jgi:hypothetical protein
MRDPLDHDLPQMSFVEWDEMVEALATCSSDQSFAEGIRLWNADRCLQHPNIHGPQRVVNSQREDGIAIMHHESVRVVARKEASELLLRPLGGRVLREIPVEDPSRANLQHQEDVDEPESCRDGRKKSQARVSRAWLRRNVLHGCEDEHGRDGTGRRSM